MTARLTVVMTRVRSRWRGVTGQAVRFGVVGVGATLTHTGVFWLGFAQIGLHHVLANVIAFLVAFEVSYRGHAGWSFAGVGDRRRGRRWRLFTVALMGLLLNVGWGWLVFDALTAGLIVFVILQAGVTPLFVFVLSRTWVFRAA